MKLSEYIKGLQECLAEHGDYDCIYSKDDEGNGYQRVVYSPSFGYYDDYDFYDEDDEDVDNDEFEKVICVN